MNRTQKITPSISQKKRMVGVRELRQNLSVYLERVKDGETLKVTEFNRVVALLTPLPVEKLSVYERMVREGRAIAPQGSLKDRRPPQKAAPGTPSSEELLAWDREDRVL